MTKPIHHICLIKGDGIGPEIMGETVRLLSATKLNLKFTEGFAGYDTYLKYGTPLPSQTLAIIKKSEAVLFGAVITPPNIKEYFSPIVKLRKMLSLYANLRPCFSLPLKNFKKGIDLVIVRENTEGLYSGQEKETPDGAIAKRVITKKASERVIDFAFRYALKHHRKKVTLAHKANILRLTDGLFLSIGKKIASSYPTVLFEDMLVDSCAMKLVKKPEEFDILVTTNMFGDILSDVASSSVGGLGVAASANLGSNFALFEPVHGGAPKYKGSNRANPLAGFFAACMMLEFLNEDKTAKMIKMAIFQSLKDGRATFDLGGKAATSEVTDEVIKNLKSICS